MRSSVASTVRCPLGGWQVLVIPGTAGAPGEARSVVMIGVNGWCRANRPGPPPGGHMKVYFSPDVADDLPSGRGPVKPLPPPTQRTGGANARRRAPTDGLGGSRRSEPVPPYAECPALRNLKHDGTGECSGISFAVGAQLTHPRVRPRPNHSHAASPVRVGGQGRWGRRVTTQVPTAPSAATASDPAGAEKQSCQERARRLVTRPPTIETPPPAFSGSMRAGAWASPLRPVPWRPG